LPVAGRLLLPPWSSPLAPGYSCRASGAGRRTNLHGEPAFDRQSYLMSSAVPSTRRQQTIEG
jgi:hypothetical protein